MEIRVKKAIGTPTKTVSVIDLGDVPDTVRAKVEAEVGEFLVERINIGLNDAESLVKGESFDPLSPTYKKKKIAEGLSGEPNLEFEGDLKDALTFKSTKQGLEVGFYGKEAWKADGHLKFSGKKNHTPQRRFLPGEGQEFNEDVTREVSNIIADTIADATSIKPSDLDDVSTKGELYSTLEEYFPSLSRIAIKAAVLRSPKLAALLDAADLLDLL